jgi:hypothetical protein
VGRAAQTDPALEQTEFPGRGAAGAAVVIQDQGHGADHRDAARDQIEQGLAQGQEPHRAEQRQHRDEGEDRRGPLEPASHAAEPVQPREDATHRPRGRAGDDRRPDHCEEDTRTGPDSRHQHEQEEEAGGDRLAHPADDHPEEEDGAAIAGARPFRQVQLRIENAVDA